MIFQEFFFHSKNSPPKIREFSILSQKKPQNFGKNSRKSPLLPGNSGGVWTMRNSGFSGKKNPKNSGIPGIPWEPQFLEPAKGKKIGLFGEFSWNLGIFPDFFFFRDGLGSSPKKKFQKIKKFQENSLDLFSFIQNSWIFFLCFPKIPGIFSVFPRKILDFLHFP